MVCRSNKPFVNQVNVFSVSLLFSKLIQRKSMKLPHKLRLTKQTKIKCVVNAFLPDNELYFVFFSSSYFNYNF